MGGEEGGYEDPLNGTVNRSSPHFPPRSGQGKQRCHGEAPPTGNTVGHTLCGRPCHSRHGYSLDTSQAYHIDNTSTVGGEGGGGGGAV